MSAVSCMVGATVVSEAQQPVSLRLVASVPPESAAPMPVQSNPLAARVTIELSNVPIATALDAIARQANVPITFSEYVVPATRRVSVRGSRITLDAALLQALRGMNVRVQITPEGAVIIVPTSDMARKQGTIIGKVVSAKTKQPVAGITILLNSVTPGVTTAADGTFRLTAEEGEHMLHVRGLGFVKQSKRIVVKAGEGVSVEVVLEPSASVLDQVVVTGTVVATERKAISTPITVISAEEIERRGITRIEQLFRGEVPGVLAIEQGTQTYSNVDWMRGNDSLGRMTIAKVYARGTASLNGADNPLKTYVDGVELLDPSYLGTIDPKTIERVEIITGPQAATIYGSGAMGGVMQIFTKQGLGQTTPDLTFHVRYGILENSVSNGRTPQHTHNASMSGGTGADFSYSGNLSYNYTGQWQPGIFNRRYGGSVGATHTRGGVMASGSLGITSGQNGTFSYESGRSLEMYSSGEWDRGDAGTRFIGEQKRINSMSSTTMSLTLDYRPLPVWSHRVTVGRNQTDMALKPVAPVLRSPGDTIVSVRSSAGQRTTASYSTTIAPRQFRAMSVNMTLGLNGSSGKQTGITGAKASTTSASYLEAAVSEWRDDRSWGAFSSMQIGVLDHLFFTLGLRGEKNPNYGEAHKIDWTPTHGVTYTMDVGELTFKVLGSYGRATRPPASELRREIVRCDAYTSPSCILMQVANPNLRPEYSRGPQGGLELYYGNVASLTVNRYAQTVTDLIQGVNVDSFWVDYPEFNFGYWHYPWQYQNTAKIRQHGWELTGSANIRFLTIKGTYSWNDSRILSVHPQYTGSDLYPGKSPARVPSHSGSMSLSYALGGTSLLFVSSYVGTSSQGWQGTAQDLNWRYGRIKTYTERIALVTTDFRQAGYVKSDLSMSHRVTPRLSATVNVTNLGNSYSGEDLSWLYPTLGRQTLFGLSYRLSQR